MTLKLYAHPLSSYCQKAKTAFYEKDVAFEEVMLDGSEPVASEFAALWPIGRFPALTDGADEKNRRLVFDATTIIEYLDVKFPAKPLIPADPDRAIEVRMWDRFFDNYVMYPQQRLVYIAIGREHDDGAPALLYADWSYAIPKRFEALWAYRDRLLARPSYARALDEARPYRHYFPLGAPEGRD